MPDDVVFEQLQALSWGDHPLARPILGTPGSVRAQTADSLRRFMTRGYGPEQLVIGAAGAITPDAFLKLCEARFADLEGSQDDAARTTPTFVGGARQENRDTEQTHFALATPGVGARHEDYFATRIFADALGGGMSSRLFQSIREERGLAYSVYAFADSYDDVGLVGAYIGADGDQILEAAKIVRAEMEAMAQETDPSEIDRARALLRASLMMSLESPASRLEAAAGQLFTFGRIMAPKEILERLAAVAAEDVERCAQRAVTGASAVAIVGAGPLEAVAQSVGAA
ncbi:MAG: pitrilysin family protein [Pseudomonadota bacterium]